VVLEPAFRFWPIESIQERRGWVYGTYAVLESKPHRELLERGRLGGRRQKHGIMYFTETQVEASFLHHEALGAALDTERVLRETHDFYELTYCEPNALVSKDRAENALLRFMELPPGDRGGAIEYIREFGDFSSVEVDEKGNLNTDVPREIKQFCERCQHPRRSVDRKSPFVMDLRDFRKVRERIQGFWDLNNALLRKDADAARLHCVRLRPDSTFHDKANWLAVGKAVLCADLSASLNPGRDNPRLILHERNGKLVLRTMCMNVRAALHFILLENVLSGTGYRRCANKNCGMYYLAVKGKKFHSSTCQNAAKVRNWRERQRKQEE
jgi:hypothetical protein